jgi:hypothetical protein
MLFPLGDDEIVEGQDAVPARVRAGHGVTLQRGSIPIVRILLGTDILPVRIVEAAIVIRPIEGSAPHHRCRTISISTVSVSTVSVSVTSYAGNWVMTV